MTTDSRLNPTAFISYSHDSPEHCDRVLELADRLLAQGIDVVLDQYESSPPEGWPLWMDRGIHQADFVLVVCTETYYRRCQGTEAAGVGRGVRWEGLLTFQALYDDDSRNTRFIPVLLDDADANWIPRPLRGATYYRLDQPDGFPHLLRRLTGQHATPKPDLGPLPILPPKPRRSDFSPLADVGAAQPVDERPWSIPYRRNPYFTGRQEVLDRLWQLLQTDGRAALGQAISGLGGVGKTQTAVELAYRHRDDYTAVLWTGAEDETILRSGVEVLAQRLALPYDPQDPDASRRAVLRWLETHDGWLLIFDNADTPDLLEPYLPSTGRGHVVITSRARTFDRLNLGPPLEMPVMPEAEAVAFLFDRLGRPPLDDAEDDAARAVARELGYLPLALEQAAAYTVEMQATWGEYLQAYQRRRLELLERAAPAAGDYTRTVATTWSLNFDQVRHQSDEAAAVLRFSAFLAPEAIPFELFGDRARDPLAFKELLAPAARFSLLTIEPANRTFSVHRLVQEVLRADHSAQEQREAAEAVVLLCRNAFPWGEFDTWTTCDRLLPHALVATELAETFQLQSTQVGGLLNQTGLYLNDRGLFTKAEPLLVSSLDMWRTTVGENDSEFSTRCTNLAALFYATGRLAEAEPLMQQALEVDRRVVGEDHPDYATSLNNLALLYYAQGRYSDAEPLYQQAAEIQRRSLGEDHPDYAQSLNNLAELYRAQGRYSDAEPLYQQAAEIQRRSLGEDHPDYAQSLNNLAALYNAQGRYSDAEPLYQQAAEIWRRSLGEDHPSYAASLNNLAELYRAQGRYSDAEPLYQQAAEIQRRFLGEDHPDYAKSLGNLGALYADQQRWDEAESLLSMALEIFRGSLGDEHPDTQSQEAGLDALRSGLWDAMRGGEDVAARDPFAVPLRDYSWADDLFAVDENSPQPPTAEGIAKEDPHNAADRIPPPESDEPFEGDAFRLPNPDD